MKVINIKDHPVLDDVESARREYDVAKSLFRKAQKRLRRNALAARKSGYSLREIAERAKVTSPTISNWETIENRNGNK